MLDRFALFVIDEAHLVAERERGWRLEEALTLLHHVTETTTHRIVLVSAAMGAGAHVAAWLSTDRPPLITSDEWRGPRRLYALFTTSFGADTEIEPQRGARLPRRKTPMIGSVHLRSSETKVVKGSFTEPVGWSVQRQSRKGGWVKDEGSTRQLDQVVPLVEHLVVDRATPTLVVVATRDQARTFAELVAARLPSAPDVALLVERIRSRVGDEHSLPGLVEKGVAYHHGALPTDVQAEIEDAARNHLIRCLVATATLTEGVNLPFKAVVIASTGYGSGDDRVEVIDAPRLVNALGRAGRACRETEAWLFLVKHASYQQRMFDDLRQTGADLPLRSSLVADEALADLAAFEGLVAAGADAVLADSGRSTNDFCSFVWHLAEVLTDLQRPSEPQDILAVLEASLAWQDADPSVRRRWQRVAETAIVAYHRSPPGTRRRWAKSGISLPGAGVLDGLRDDLIPIVLSRRPVDLHGWIDALMGDGRLGRMLTMPENKLRGFKPYRTASALPGLGVDLLGLLHAWVDGRELEDLGSAYLGGITNPDYRADALSEFTSTVFEHHLP